MVHGYIISLVTSNYYQHRLVKIAALSKSSNSNLSYQNTSTSELTITSGFMNSKEIEQLHTNSKGKNPRLLQIYLV